MVIVKEDLDFKSRLVTEICFISTHSNGCNHRRLRYIDWYRLLQVEEDADIDVIRKQYRNLALQLHPDKNKHPKAEVAFKLVLEAYTCLSDAAKRKAFDAQRWKNFCPECNQSLHRACNVPGRSDTEKPRRLDPRCWSRSKSNNKILQGLKEVRDRFKEEAKVIENCLRAYESSKKESPLFDPSERLFQDYPHRRTRIYYNKHEVFGYMQPENLRKHDHRTTKCKPQGNSWRYEGRNEKCESPIYEIRSERRML
ncbi:PREDICTED: pre-mRNA-splicing factor cwf23 [Nelumbo nucifera]|uniref:Pre-mRNA-splicing factor cwf23 n=2 Tax=Nelumbo nucifera TaxID=4432 RepID=A0A1U7Z3Z1_NELNU|nr:PREDICTED: pre-mRNA-splicing factor cwf23 [Nelumbo nucifera]DAD33216.1 TPA_asm: hypothetical protein HUJ06_012067 [Nelumbo nucifera]